VLRNQLALVRDGELRRLHRPRLRQIEANVLRLESRMVAAIAAVPAMAVQYALLCSMPGVGLVLAATLLARLPRLGSISHRQIGSLAGVVPYAWDSGKLKGLRQIFGAHGDVRGVLYMAARSGAQHNPVLKAWYGRLLTAGKPPMVAIVAVIRKMLVSLSAMVRHNQPRQGPMEASLAK
jgi:transposase